MRVRVLLFAAHREAVGRSLVEVELPPSAVAADAYSAVAPANPRMEELRHYTTFAVNRRVVTPDQSLHDGDEIALLQPMSGGSV